MSKKLVLMLSSNGANDAIRGLLKEYGDTLISLGLAVVNVEPDEANYAIEQVSNGNVAFATTWVGYGQELDVTLGKGGATVNLWEYFQVPLLKFHGDLPAYFSARHGNVPATSVNLYHAREFAHFRRHWMPQARTLAATIPPLPISPISRDGFDQRRRRQGKLVFLKNGNSPEGLRRLWNERLSGSVARLVAALADAITPIGLASGPLDIGGFTAGFLDGEGFDARTMPGMHLFLCAQIDDYLRRVKSRMITEALLDLPVVIQGSNWDHIDFTGRKAQCVAGLEFGATQRIFAEQLGIIDMSPNVDSWPHDRVQRAAGSFALVLTNRQSWIAEGFPALSDLTFEFDPDSIRTRASDAIAHPDRYLELGVDFGERFRQLYTREAFGNRIVDIAEIAALHYSAAKPTIQPYFGWPGNQ